MFYLDRQGVDSASVIRFENAAAGRLRPPTRLPTLLVTTTFARRVRNLLSMMVGR